MIKHFIGTTLCVIAFCVAANAQQSSSKAIAPQNILKQKLDSVVKKYKGTIGVAVSDMSGNEAVTINNDHHYPMLSTYKFPLALFVLHQVDMGALSLSKKIHISKGDLHETWSPLRDKYPEGNIDLTIGELLDYSVSKSDNNTTDILFRLVKGTGSVNKYIHRQGVNNIGIVATEVEMGAAWDVQYTNWAEPEAFVNLLKRFFQGTLLTHQSTKFLMHLMTASENSPNRIKGLLPAGTVVAHKTGTSNTNDQGMTAAVNDVGIITLPNGDHFAIAVFVSNTSETKETAEKIIAEIARTAFDHLAAKKHFVPKVDSMDLFDKARNRLVPILLYQPYQVPKVGKTKIALINHGYNRNKPGAYKQYSYLADHLASKNYLVVSIQHELPTDDTLPTTGKPAEIRRPNWERGSENMQFVITKLKNKYNYLDFKHLIILGHSNGGDMAMLFATEHPHDVDKVISLDNRRMPLPRTSHPKIYSIRSSDQPADDGVLPTDEEQKKFGITIIRQNSTKHNEMDDDANESQRKEILDYVDTFLRN